MAAFDKMTMWEVNRRLDTLHEFEKLLVEYYDNVEAVSFLRVQPNNQGVQIRQTINDMLDQVRECMYLAGYNTEIVYTDPPAVGGRRQIVSLLENLYDLSQFQISPLTLLDQIEQAIGKYKSSRPRAIRRTLNPFFWLNELIASIIGFPFRLLVSARLVDESTLDSSRAFTIIKGIFVFLGTLITYAVGIVTIADKLGYLGSLKQLIKGIF